VSEGEEVAHDRVVKMAAEWHRVGLERPHFVATGTVAVAPAQQMEAGEEGKNYSLHFAFCHFSSPVMQVIVTQAA